MKNKIVVFIILILGIGLVGAGFIYMYLESNLILKIKGEPIVYLEVNETYEDLGATASYRNQNLDNMITLDTNLNKDVLGTYKVIYKIKYKKFEKEIEREIIVRDSTKPVITLNGDEKVRVFLNEEYQELGASSTDNYDGDITDKVDISSTVDTSKLGEYTVKYTSIDSSNNTSTVERIVEVVNRPVINNQGVAVINYHFLYRDNENCGETICLKESRFKEQLDYLKENNYKTLTMDEFVKWMYGEIDVPEKSVLLTFDDGAMGTSKINGNILIPLLEEYNMHATLFLITGWWKVEDYESPNLDVESHTDNMHIEGFCEGVDRGAKMLCLSKEEDKKDIETSISKLGSHLAFAYPFYEYDDKSIEVLKELDFKVAFTGGGRKVTRYDNKYLLPRFVMWYDTPIETFISWVS